MWEMRGMEGDGEHVCGEFKREKGGQKGKG